jgi:hypothetical protein
MDGYVRNVWEFQTKEFTTNFFKEKEQRDLNLINRILNQHNLLRLANMCFNNCVTNFKDATLNYEEMKCMSNCKNTSLKYLLNNHFSERLNN